MSETIKNRPTNPHRYPELARSRGKRQTAPDRVDVGSVAFLGTVESKAAGKAQDAIGVPAATIGHPKAAEPSSDATVARQTGLGR